MPIQKKIDLNFFKKWTPKMAYVLGFLAADGYVTLNKRGGYFWNIQIADGAHLRRIKRILCSEHKISRRKLHRDGNIYTLYRFQVGSKDMCRDLMNLGISEKKTHNLSIPHVPEGLMSHFVRGYFDGDGNVWTGLTNKKRGNPTQIILTAFTSCSLDFLGLLHAELKKNGVEGGMIYRPKKNCGRLQLATQDSLKLYYFMYNHDVLRKEGLFLPRKKKVFERYLKLRL